MNQADPRLKIKSTISSIPTLGIGFCSGEPPMMPALPNSTRIFLDYQIIPVFPD
jgi:hypothetical protein